jgi:hypothetical protein
MGPQPSTPDQPDKLAQLGAAARNWLAASGEEDRLHSSMSKTARAVSQEEFQQVATTAAQASKARKVVRICAVISGAVVLAAMGMAVPLLLVATPAAMTAAGIAGLTAATSTVAAISALNKANEHDNQLTAASAEWQNLSEADREHQQYEGAKAAERETAKTFDTILRDPDVQNNPEVHRVFDTAMRLTGAMDLKSRDTWQQAAKLLPANRRLRRKTPILRPHRSTSAKPLAGLDVLHFRNFPCHPQFHAVLVV